MLCEKYVTPLFISHLTGYEMFFIQKLYKKTLGKMVIEHEIR